MKQPEKLTLPEVEVLLKGKLSKSEFVSIAYDRFGISSAQNKSKKELRELIGIAINHEMSMEVIKIMGSM